MDLSQGAESWPIAGLVIQRGNGVIDVADDIRLPVTDLSEEVSYQSESTMSFGQCLAVVFTVALAIFILCCGIPAGHSLRTDALADSSPLEGTYTH